MSEAASGGLKRPKGLTLHTLEVPAVPQGAPPTALGEGDIPNSDMQFVTLIVAAECVAPGLWGKVMGHNWLCKLQ